jgi:hypothetical protein
MYCPLEKWAIQDEKLLVKQGMQLGEKSHESTEATILPSFFM